MGRKSKNRFKRVLLIVTCLAFAVAGTALLLNIRFLMIDKPSRVLVLGIDGATWKVLKPMFRKGELPNLKRIYDAGQNSVLISRKPMLSPVVWSTIFTGKLSKDHGVKHWDTSQSKHRRVKAVWRITSEAAKRTHVLNVPSSWPPEEINGNMISGFPLSGATFTNYEGHVEYIHEGSETSLPKRFTKTRSVILEHAARLKPGEWSPWFDVVFNKRPRGKKGQARIKKIASDRVYVSPFYRVDDEFQVTYPKSYRRHIEKAIGVKYIAEGPGWNSFAKEDTPSYLGEHLEQISRIQTAAALATLKSDWDLFVYVLTLVDRVSHPYWSYMFPNEYNDVDPMKAKLYGEAVRNAYRETDRQVGELLSAVGSKYGNDYFLIIVSDHGFQANRDRDRHIGIHHRYGVYMVSGPGMSHSWGPRTNIEDITPTILYMLNLPVAADMKGKIIKPLTRIYGTPPDSIPSYETQVRPEMNIPVDQSTWEQLRSLGYVDDKSPTHPKDDDK